MNDPKLLEQDNPPPIIPELDRLEDRDLAHCESLILCLSNHRFVILYPDEGAHDLWPINGGWEKIRELVVGDQVVYRGKLATVRGIGVYR